MKPAAAVMWGVLAAVFFSAPSYGADGGTLRYRQALPPMLEQEAWYLSPQELTPAAEKPEVKAEPTYAGTPIYFLIDLGEKGSPPHLAAYDPKGGGGKGAVYFDLDQDGDLAEEEPLLPQSWGGSENFGPIAVKLKRDGFVGLYHCWMDRRPNMRVVVDVLSAAPANAVPSGVAPSPPDSWALRPGCMNVGEITFEGKTYKAAMVDAFTNGRFNDICWSRLGQGDVLLVDWNGDGKFDWNTYEYVMVGERYWRNGKWYRPSFSTDGTEVSFAPGDFELAPLLTGQEKFWMQITSKSNTGSVQIEGAGGRVDLPVDTYSLYLCWAEAKDAEGNTWKAQAMLAGPYPSFEVKAGEENRYVFGPPFGVSLKASPEGPYGAGQTITVLASVVGAEGKNYVLTRGGGPLSAPNVVLKDESGKEISSFQLGYG
jgi:hypothetical protein